MTRPFVDIEHERLMAAFHQRWLIVNAWLFAISGILAFVASPWLFAQTFLFLLAARDHRRRRNRALDRLERNVMGCGFRARMIG